MSHPPISIVHQYVQTSSNGVVELKNYRTTNAATIQQTGMGLDAGGRIVVESGTPTVVLTDAIGQVLVNQALTTAGLTVDPTARGIQLPLSATITNIGTGLTIDWFVKR